MPEVNINIHVGATSDTAASVIVAGTRGASGVTTAPSGSKCERILRVVRKHLSLYCLAKSHLCLTKFVWIVVYIAFIFIGTPLIICSTPPLTATIVLTTTIFGSLLLCTCLCYCFSLSIRGNSVIGRELLAMTKKSTRYSLVLILYAITCFCLGFLIDTLFLKEFDSSFPNFVANSQL